MKGWLKVPRRGLFSMCGPCLNDRDALPARHFFQSHFRTHGCTFGIAAVISTPRSISPAISPSRTQSNACHQSS
jgi:hypothetical protein